MNKTPKAITTVKPELDLNLATEKVLRNSIAALRKVIIDCAQLDLFGQCHVASVCAEQLQNSLDAYLHPELYCDHNHGA